MGRIDELTIQRVLDAADIVEVIGDFVELRQKGARWIGLCPFHEDRHATNFSVYPAKQCFTCFACGAKGGVVEFLKMHEKISFPDAIRWLGKKYGIPVDDVPLNYTPPPPRPRPAPLPMLVIPDGMVRSGRLEQDALVGWLRGLPWDGAQLARIDKVLAEYKVGHSRKGYTVFWQIDDEGLTRTGKMMIYKADGHRDKEMPYSFSWVHSTLNRLHIVDLTKTEVKQCLFGLHLVNKYPNAEVKIVESEKTAVIMAVAYGNHEHQVWMACGGAENLTRERLAPLMKAGRRITIYPDRDKVDEWRARAANMRYLNICVDATPVTKWWKPCDGEKADIADVVVRSICDNKKTIE
jgi:hypothetical protein